MDLHDLRCERFEGYAVATIQRPEVLNAFRERTFADLLTVLDEARRDEGVRVLVLTGEGRAFSSGIDLRETAQRLGEAATITASLANLRAMQDVTRQFVHHPKVILCALNGLAVGVGAELALNSDVRLASTTASFAFTEARRGLFQTNGVMYLLPRLVGLGRASHWLLTGERVSADEALASGLITRVVAPDALLETAHELARTIAANAPLSVRLVKRTLARTFDLDLEGVMGLEVEGMLECLGSEDVLEGTQAFLEKREAQFRGR